MNNNSIFGGLLQIVATGKADSYLTYNPEITFFKKVYRRHTNFAIELKENLPEYQYDFNTNISFNLTNCDAIYRCYFEIELPLIRFKDNHVTNTEYLFNKENRKSNLMNSIHILQLNYDNFKNYANIELQLYQLLLINLQISNISIINLHKIVYKFNEENKSLKEKYINKIDSDIYNNINISNYILALNINDIINTQVIVDNLDRYNKIIFYYAQVYNEQIIKLQDELVNIDYINFNYTEYLGHHFFQHCSLDIGGQFITKYTNDILHIHQIHNIKNNSLDVYNNLIGNQPNMISFDKQAKGNCKLLIPLIFWFNNNIGSCLPVISLQYSTIVITAKINDIKKLLSFNNFSNDYANLLIVDIPFQSFDNIIINNNLIYDKYIIKYNVSKVTYYCKYINKELLKLQFNTLTDYDISYILENNGKYYSQLELQIKKKYSITDDTNINNYTSLDVVDVPVYLAQHIIDEFRWISLMISIQNKTFTGDLNIYSKFLSYYPYIDFNVYYSTIQCPKIKLISECIYLDDFERNKFASANLEYITEMYDENIFNFKNKSYYDCSLSFTNPTKELYWYVQPQILSQGFLPSEQNTEFKFIFDKYLKNEIIKTQNLTFDRNSALSEDNMLFYTYVVSNKYLNNILPDGVYYKSFCLYPEENQPSGTINLQYFKDKKYSIDINSEFLKEYKNFLKIIYNDEEIYEIYDSYMIKFIAKYYKIIQITKGKIIL